jgi:hypothetical protein
MDQVVTSIVTELRQLITNKNSNKGWSFVDLGCGQGVMLRAMSEEMLDAKPMFERCIGVELNPWTAREASANTSGCTRIEVVTGDMFEYVEGFFNVSQNQHVIFYIYEPLWMSGLSNEVMDRLYNGLLEQIAKHPGCIVIYCSADSFREIKTSVFEQNGFVLKKRMLVAQNGAFNKLRGKYNSLEIWEVS